MFNWIMVILATMGAITFVTMVVAFVFVMMDRHPAPIDTYWGNDNPIPYTLAEADKALLTSRARLDSYVKPVNNHTRRV